MGPRGEGPETVETSSGPPTTNKTRNPRGRLTLGVQPIIGEKTGMGALRSPTQVLITCPAGRSPAVTPIPRPRSPVVREEKKKIHHQKCDKERKRKNVGSDEKIYEKEKNKRIKNVGCVDKTSRKSEGKKKRGEKKLKLKKKNPSSKSRK